jgi:hypothetical protein
MKRKAFGDARLEKKGLHYIKQWKENRLSLRNFFTQKVVVSNVSGYTREGDAG